ncbi:protein cueball [Amyelois transitella]|uniref:protein cueball n=1 Tax=Amyelois transitella TaxID=680683 RepID=UPI00298FE366|nr:protein cueball [Amyelois transitella]
MCNIQCLLAVSALFVGLVNSWDIAITAGDQIEFYTNETKTSEAGLRFRDLSALAYDAVHNMLLFVDKQNDNASIFSYQLANKKYQSLVRRRSDENIQGLAFDPVKGLLFWTDANERSIFWISLKDRANNDPYGNLLLKMNDDIPRAIAVDSCRGYIYWTNINITRPTIERARFDGSERTVIVDKNIYSPVSIAVDLKTHKLYWLDDREGIHYSIETSDLEGKNRQTLLVGTHHRPNALTISNDAVYWIDWGYNTVWKIPKDARKDTEPKEIVNFVDRSPFVGIVANYTIQDQINGVQGCENLVTIAENKSAINDLSTFKISPDEGLFCLHGEKLNGKACKCSQGYKGDRCDVSLCHNYCLEGDCSIGTDGNPQCRCNKGFSGARCQLNVCDNHCLNNGYCSLDSKAEPVCHCPGDYEGARCETLKPITTLQPETCNCTKQNAVFLSDGANEIHYVDVTGCDSSWDAVRDPVIMVLGIVCGLLCITSTVLCTKVMKLKKRPRIKKRIIVNKNVTPMTARPDQCEITIENCCNMNICETPCFEPRSTIRPTLLDSKPGKEEKKNLISNMEYPEDY